MTRKAIIIGAGPAGLTAGLELLRRTDIVPIILEASNEIGGLSRTIRYKGNRMDIGGHRFFSKSDRVMKWWMEMMPIADLPSSEKDTVIGYRGKSRTIPVRSPDEIVTETSSATAMAAAPPPDADRVMLIRPRKSRIYFLRTFFDYPISLSKDTLKKLGLVRTIRVGISYIAARFHQIKPELTLEDFFTNRFGRELYLTFFKSYTEKVWGHPCSEISAEWGAQRIKGLSLMTAIKHFIRKTLIGQSGEMEDIAQKGTNTSLIERFMYPKLGPGQLWEHVADEIKRLGGEIHLERTVVGMKCSKNHVNRVLVKDPKQARHVFAGDYFFSTMPVRDLVRAMDAPVPANVREVSEGLQYRDFITVGLLINRLKVHETDGSMLKDTWIYVQEPDVRLGRLQIFNNWSPYLVSDPGKVWIGLEYFCSEGDDLWSMPDERIEEFAARELEKIGIVEESSVSDSHVVRVPKTYPAYFGTYSRFSELRQWIDTFENLFLVGRNGMHKYNNQDHSMLTAMTVVDGLCAGSVDRAALWGINTEQNYQEENGDSGTSSGKEVSGLPPRSVPVPASAN